jgi:hypothetical protein
MSNGHFKNCDIYHIIQQIYFIIMLSSSATGGATAILILKISRGSRTKIIKPQKTALRGRTGRINPARSIGCGSIIPRHAVGQIWRQRPCGRNSWAG